MRVTVGVGFRDVGTNVDLASVRRIAEWAVVVEACGSFDGVELGFFNVY